jgi:hypothetical protein
VKFRSILLRIYGPVIDGGRWRIRTNQELYQLCGENDIVKFCKLSRLRWAGHVIRQDDEDLSRRVLLNEPGGKRPRGRPRLLWEDGVKEDAAKLGCRNGTVVALNREGWRKRLKEAEAHPGL